MKNSLKNSNKFHLILQANSPGEISNWAIPFAKKFIEKLPQSEISLFITPCQYASGQEAETAIKTQLFSQVFSPNESIKKIFSLPFFQKKARKGAVLCLGGDPFYSKLLGFKYHFPVFVYTERKPYKSFLVKRVFSKYEYGDLMSERINQFQTGFNQERIREKYRLNKNRYALFFAGSRPQHFQALIPNYQEIVRKIKEIKPDFQAILQISPFITENFFEKINQNLKLEQEFIVLRGESVELMAISDLLITIPSTSTAEAGYMQLPMLVVVPTNRPDLIIFDGLFGLIGNAPILGILIKKLIIWFLKRKNPLLALPNIMAKKEIVPELKGDLKIKDVVDQIIKIYYSETELKKLKSQLTLIKPTKNTVDLIIKEMTHIST